MSHLLRPVCFAAVFAAAPTLAASAPAAAAGGLVMGVDGRVYQHAKVCVDRNGNARCDAGERGVFTDSKGRFELAAGGALVAEIGRGTVLVDTAAGTTTAVARPLVFRAPAAAGVGARTIGPLSTELQSAVDGARRGGASPDAAGSRMDERLGAGRIDPAAADALAGAEGRAALVAEQAAVLDRIADAVAEAGRKGDLAAALDNRLDLEAIRNVVVIYAENRSFNNLFANFPGARGLASGRGAGFAPQKDRDGSVLAKLPPAWGGLTAAGQAVVVTQAQTTNVLPNAPFAIDSALPAWGAPAVTSSVVTRDLYHRFYENQMQIGGGANDKFAAWGDSGGLVMGHFDGSHTALWDLARRYTLADNFFQGAFGGSFLNHQYLICACAPEFPDADSSPAHPSIAALRQGADGKFTPDLALAPNSPPSALTGPPVFVRSGNLAPKDYFGDGTFRAVNTMQPAFQPSGNPPVAADAGGKTADPRAATTLPAQTQATLGDALSAKGLAWAWYAGGWNDASADRSRVYKAATGNFQAHHQPFNYYAAFDPSTRADARAEHLKDGADLVADASAGTLPTVAFYKPIGVDNEHPGYASLAAGDAHIAGLIAKLRAGPQWRHMLIVVTYDENGGQWDEVAPPKGDLLGPGTRVPAVVVSPFARRGYVDHTQYDTGSVARFLTHRFSLSPLVGVRQRDDALAAHGAPGMGDLTNALDFRLDPRAAR
ncbi:MAG: acid phosphatase [Burkholderiaceae bacterium]